MPLPRLQLFEFNDSAWAPAPARELIVESLSRTLRWGRMLEGVVQPLTELLEETGATEVLDLAAGAGGPAWALVEELKAAGRAPPRFLLSDLQPHVEEWTALQALHPEAIDFIPTAVDALAVAPELARGRVQLVINALHHFPPPLAKQLLLAACRDSEGVLIAEGLVRNPLSFLPLAIFGIPALFATPWLSKRHRLAKVGLAWLSPFGLALSAWDGTVSSMRMYVESELREMVAETLPGWRWDFGSYGFQFGGRGSWFRGVKLR